MRHLVWFSCGAASAVAAKIAVETYGHKCEVLYCNTLATEHPDNSRFFTDVERWIGRKILLISSSKYRTVDEVFEKTRYMSGIKGARCTVEMKKVPREEYQQIDDVHIFGYTSDEQKRADQFERQNPSVQVEWLLIDNGISKNECLDRLKDAGIALPAMYGLGFDHNNCLGCVKATSPGYWNRIRRHFPTDFARRASQSRALGVRLARYKGERIFLDMLPSEAYAPDDAIDCGPICQSPQVTEWPLED